MGIDLLQFFYGNNLPRISCLDHGHVMLVDIMPRIVEQGQTADNAVLDAARLSYSSNTDKKYSGAENRGLIRYLLRKHHHSPFEMVKIKFDIRLPIFVARQLIRHRTSSLNEISARYSKLPAEYYIPSTQEIRAQSTSNKQGSDGRVSDEVASDFVEWTEDTAKRHSAYDEFAELGVAREMARINLPLNIYTHWIWCTDLRNLLHLLDLRCDSHAQYEIRVYAQAMLKLIGPLLPFTIEAWEDFSPFRGGVILTKLEADAIRKFNRSHRSADQTFDADHALPTEIATVREQGEWEEKKKSLGF